MVRKNAVFSLLAIGLIGFSSCKKDKAEEPKKNEENEVITTVKISLTSTSGAVLAASWKDLTPNDEAGRTIDTLKIDSGLVYTGKVELLDETKSPADNITAEVKEEANDHIFIYTQVPATPELIAIARTDKDSKNLETGLEFTLTALNKGVGKLNVILKHQPGVKDGTSAPGDEDINIEIPFISKGK